MEPNAVSSLTFVASSLEAGHREPENRNEFSFPLPSGLYRAIFPCYRFVPRKSLASARYRVYCHK